MAERRSVAEMVGEFLREAAVLVMVFTPLDLLVLNQPLTAKSWSVTLAIAGGLLGLGIGVERWRKS